MNNNLILSVDSYKHSQYLQYPANTTKIFSYIESRGGEFDTTVFFGLQAYIKQYLTAPITMKMIDEAEFIINAHIGPGLFNREGWEYIVNELDGKLPLVIKALPEGTVVNTKNVLAVVENTDPKCFWLTSFIETSMLRGIWYPTTVATKSREVKKLINEYLTNTADNNDGLAFTLHDFGARGTSSGESAGIGGGAHLVNFMGTDTIEGMMWLMDNYNTTEVPAFSVPASEHSTITSWMKKGELDAYRNMFTQFGGKFPIVSVVSDSYDIYNAVEHMWGTELKDMVINSGSTLVVRPDSGEPADVVAKVALLLDTTFGSTTNSKGYKVLNGVKILQGDGLNNVEDIRKILAKLIGYGFSADNIVFGMGGGLLQQVNRDTLRFAMKASWAEVDGEGRDVFKDPVTDSIKKSKRGRLGSMVVDGVITTVSEAEAEVGDANLLEVVYLNGELVRDVTLADVRELATL